MAAAQPIQEPLGLCLLARAHQNTGHGAGKRQVGRRTIRERKPDQAFGFTRAFGDIGNHGAMQSINAALAPRFRQRAQRGQRRIRLAPSLLCPGNQQGLQKAGHALVWQAAEALFRAIKPPGLRILPGQQHGGQRFIGDDTRQPYGFRTAIQQGRDKGALQHFRLIRIAPECLQEAFGSEFRIGFIGGEAPGQIRPEGTGHFRRGAAQRGAFHAIAGRTGGKQRGGQQPIAAGRE